MTRIALLQTDLSIDRPDVETAKYGLSNSERDTLVSALGTSDVLICDMNLLREDSYRFLLDIQSELKAAIERGAGLVCLTTRPTIRTSAGTKNVYTWIPGIGETVKVQDDLVTKVVYEPKETGPSFAGPVLSSLFATCAFEASSLNGSSAFLVSEDHTPVGLTHNMGQGFVMMLPQSEDKKGLLTSVIEWIQARPKGGAKPAAVAAAPAAAPVAADDVSTLDEVLDLSAVSASTPAEASGDAASDAADLAVPTMDDLAAQAEAEGVVDLSSAAEPEPKETDEFDAKSLEAPSEPAPDEDAVPTGDDPFSKRLSFDPAQATRAPAPDADRTVFMAPTVPPPVAAVPAKAAEPAAEKPARHHASPPVGDPEDFDKAFNLDSPDPFGSLEEGKWASEETPEAGAKPAAGGPSGSSLDAEPEAEEPVAASLRAEIPRPAAAAPADEPAVDESSPAAANEPPPLDLEVPAAPEPQAAAPAVPAVPVWMDELHESLPGLSDILARQQAIREEIQKLEDENKTLQAKRAKVDGWSPLVTGEPETFHRAVRNFFGNILSTSTEITHQGLITADAGIGKFLILPVTKEEIAKADVGRLLLHALADADVQTKGVIVVNHEREKNALHRSPIDPGLGELAKKRDFVVVPSLLLYRVAIQHTLDEDPPNVIDIVQQIYSSAGLVTILR